MSGLQFSPAQVPNPVPAAPGRAGPRRRTRGVVFWLMIILLVLLALGAAGGGAAGFVKAAHRHPTQAQIADAGKREQAVLWERLSAGQIFPASVSYPNTLGADTKATLVGIAPQAPCRSAVDAKAAPVLAVAGCLIMLRATYADASGTALATFGIAVMRSPAAAASAMGKLRVSGGGLLPLSFRGTVANAFTGKARETYGVQDFVGPYLFLYASGYADGRATRLSAQDVDQHLGETVTADLGVNVVSSLVHTFQAPPNPCEDKNIRC